MNAYPPEEAVPAEPGGPVVLAVRAGRGLLVRGDRDHRRVPAALLQAEHDAGRLPRLVPQAGRRPDEPGVPVDAGYQLRRARRAADAADPPLGGAAVHRGGMRAPAAALLHRRVPQAALAELADLGDPAGAGHGGRGIGHHPPGRPDVRREPQRARGGHAVDPGHRHAPHVVDLRRGLPRARDHRAGVLAARGGAAGGDGRAVRAATATATRPAGGHARFRGDVLVHRRDPRALRNVRAGQSRLAVRAQPAGEHQRRIGARLVPGLP